MNRRLFIQLLAVLPFFRPKLRAEDNPTGYIAGVDLAAPAGDNSALCMITACRDCHFFAFRARYVQNKNGNYGFEALNSYCARHGVEVSPSGRCPDFQFKSVLCPRCCIGVDDDGDGNCAFCGNLTDEQVRGMQRWRGAKLQSLRTAKIHDGGREIAFPFITERRGG